MITKTFTYRDYDDVSQTETFNFHLTKSEILELTDLLPRLQAWRNVTDGPARDLTDSEVRELLSIVRMLIDASYGVREGKRFKKDRDTFLEFKESAAYDEFLFGLFSPDPEVAVAFITALIPQDLIEQAQAEARANETAALPGSTDDEQPAWIREDREPTREELSSMTKEQMQEVFRLRFEKANQVSSQQ